MKAEKSQLQGSTSPVPSFYNTGSRPMTHNKSEPSKIAPSGPRHTTSASVTNREVTRVGYRHGFQEGQMIGNRKQSVTNDTDVQKGNVMAVETKQKDNLKNRLWLTEGFPSLLGHPRQIPCH
ncbi:LOW QUALITY PROTEIN: hypothetical protein HID58_072277 [Brassica napus]|uniref:Uncharacterized protein n=1 Tax=Brassica napus TaxID=3708 RepID=A0ABQ7Z473_BRANA|nr:LOW QUALITY PROTEIN: hypothetical protein HID58_072277 [Brassica napus]